MSIEAILVAVGKHVAKKVSDSVWNLVTTRVEKRHTVENRIERAVDTHLTFVSNWSFSSQFRGQTVPQNTAAATIPLRFTITPRRFRQIGGETATFSEPEILERGHHTLITGLPGAGKTTAMRRLCQVLLLDDAILQVDKFQFPIVVRLREIRVAEHQQSPLLNQIARIVGLHTRIRSEQFEREHVVPPTLAEERMHKENNKDKASYEPLQPKRWIEKYYVHTELCEEEALEPFIVQVLNELSPIIMLDGLDEIDPVNRERIDKDIRCLVEGTRSSLVIVSCRSGELVDRLGSMLQLEVCDFRDDDVKLMAELWLKDAAPDFLKKISPPPIQELTSRPLLLAQMLNLFSMGSQLPTQPYRLYKQLALLMIREWDSQRDVFRKSRYADFGPDEKLSFLAEISYELTFGARIKVFSEHELIDIYLTLAEKYDLPKEEALIVAKEIESHTGIIVEYGHHHYAFSHLTFQEYLTAEHLLKLAFPFKRLPSHLAIAAPSMAIATALSGSPAQWLNAVLLSPLVVYSDDFLPLFRYIDRLALENPRFAERQDIAYVMLDLMTKLANLESVNPFDKGRLTNYLDGLMSRKFARASLSKLLANDYIISSADTDINKIAIDNIKIRKEGRIVYGLEASTLVFIERQWLKSHPDFENEVKALRPIERFAS